jgi:heptosyltransferase-2
MTASPRILIVGPAWVGDMVMAQSLFMRLREEHPQARIEVLAPSWTGPLLARMPQVDASIALPLGHGELGLMRRLRLGWSLRARHYDWAIVLPRAWKAALVPWLAQARRRTGYLGEMRYGLLNDLRKLDETRLTQTVQRFVALAGPAEATTAPLIPPPQLRIDPQQQRAALSRLGLTEDLARPIIGLAPGAEYGPAKQWPAEYFHALAGALAAQGNAVWIFGSAKESMLGEYIAQHVGVGLPIRNLCGRTQLTEVIDLMALCRQVVSNDSGLMHVAAAVGAPLVALYGSSSPYFTPPLSSQAQIIWLQLACSPCFARRCPLGHTHCLYQIQPDEVLARLSSSP